MLNKSSCKSLLSRYSKRSTCCHPKLDLESLCYNGEALNRWPAGFQGDVALGEEPTFKKTAFTYPRNLLSGICRWDEQQTPDRNTRGIADRGFTLIELLVVVLIIGILSSIAIPQYQKAVWKSRAAALMTYVKAVGEAQERYFLANGEYADSMEELDIDMPKVSTIPSNCGVYVVGWGGVQGTTNGFCVDQYACVCFNQHGDRRAELAYFKEGPYKNAGFLWNHSMIGLTKGVMYCRGTPYTGFGPSGEEFCKKMFGLTTTQSDYWGKPYYPMNR